MRQAAARGLVWQGGQALFNRGLSLITFIVLARLLSPREYGLVALATVFIGLLGMLAAAGFSQALVQRPSVDHQDLDTMFWIGLATSLLLTLVLFAAAGPLADLYGEPQLRPVLQVLSVTFVFIALGGTHQAVLQRRLAFASIARAAMVANVAATVAGITFAIVGLGVWALVVQVVLGVALTSLGMTAQSGYRPSLYVSWARFKPMFALSRNYLGSGLMNVFNTRLDDFLVGGVLGTVALGVYAVAYRLLLVMLEVLALSARGVAFPMFARLQHDRARLTTAYRSAMRMCAVVAVPPFLFVLVAAPELVLVLFGEPWAASVPVLQVLCLYGALQAVMQFNDSLLDATGHAKITFRVTLAGTVLQAAAFAVAVRYGIMWVAASYVARAYFMAPVGLWFSGRVLGAPVLETLRSLAAPILSAGAMAAAVWGASRALDAQPALVGLLGMALTAVCVYPIVLRALGPAQFAEATAFIRAAAQRRTAVVAA